MDDSTEFILYFEQTKTQIKKTKKKKESWP